jgi:thioredoxin-like negative regulator of GroEL
MDKHFLEFWGNLLLQAAQGQAQIENTAQWLKKNHSMEPFTTLFKRIYNLDSAATPSDAYQATWQEAMERFKKAYEGYLSLLDTVPQERYRELESQNQLLKKEVARQQEEIERLRRILKKDGSDADQAVRELQTLLIKQQREFQDLTRQFESFWAPKTK